MIFLYAVPPRLGSDGGKAAGGLKATAAGTVCLQTRAVARRRLQSSGRRHRNRAGGFCCFSPPKSREKSFPELYAESSRGFRKIAVFTNFFLLVLLGPKVPKASARRFPRECASRGAARGAQDQAYAPPRDGRAAARPLFFRVKRECGFIVPPAAALLYNALWKPVSTYLSCPPPAACHFCFAKPTTLATPFFLSPQGDPRLGSDGERAAGGLKAPAAGTVCLQTRAVARRRFQTSGRRHRNRSGGFCCFSTPKSREKSFPEFYAESSRGFRKIAVFTNFFFLYFWGQKYQKPPHDVFRGIARAAALHGARKIKPMRHPVTSAPQPAPSFSASNESADLLCRRWRQRI